MSFLNTPLIKKNPLFLKESKNCEVVNIVNPCIILVRHGQRQEERERERKRESECGSKKEHDEGERVFETMGKERGKYYSAVGKQKYGFKMH